MAAACNKKNRRPIGRLLNYVWCTLCDVRQVQLQELQPWAVPVSTLAGNMDSAA
jgi:hypothetical protein